MIEYLINKGFVQTEERLLHGRHKVHYFTYNSNRNVLNDWCETIVGNIVFSLIYVPFTGETSISEYAPRDGDRYDILSDAIVTTEEQFEVLFDIFKIFPKP